jgi:hypothetical protein
MRMRRHRLVFLILPLILLSHVGCEDEHRRPAKIYLPQGYVGWVRIEYGVQGAPELERDFFGPWEYQRFPPSGLLQTSSKLYDGAASVNYFYYSANDVTPLPDQMINGGLISWCVLKSDGTRLERNFLTFFVGPTEGYEKHKQELERFRKGDCQYVIESLEDLPKVGNLGEQQLLALVNATLPLDSCNRLFDLSLFIRV